MNRAKLRIVADEPAPPEAQWLALTEEHDRLAARIREVRARRQALKAGIMSRLGSWGLSDDQVTQALGGGRG